MTVDGLARKLGLEWISQARPDAEILGGYTGDLLSYVMGRITPGDAWVTIMVNSNVVAVASLGDASCVIVADGSEIPEELAELARQKDINLLRSSLPAFKICAEMSVLI